MSQKNFSMNVHTKMTPSKYLRFQEKNSYAIGLNLKKNLEYTKNSKKILCKNRYKFLYNVYNCKKNFFYVYHQKRFGYKIKFSFQKFCLVTLLHKNSFFFFLNCAKNINIV